MVAAVTHAFHSVVNLRYNLFLIRRHKSLLFTMLTLSQTCIWPIARLFETTCRQNGAVEEVKLQFYLHIERSVFRVREKISRALDQECVLLLLWYVKIEATWWRHTIGNRCTIINHLASAILPSFQRLPPMFTHYMDLYNPLPSTLWGVKYIIFIFFEIFNTKL